MFKTGTAGSLEPATKTNASSVNVFMLRVARPGGIAGKCVSKRKWKSIQPGRAEFTQLILPRAGCSTGYGCDFAWGSGAPVRPALNASQLANSHELITNATTAVITITNRALFLFSAMMLKLQPVGCPYVGQVEAEDYCALAWFAAVIPAQSPKA